MTEGRPRGWASLTVQQRRLEARCLEGGQHPELPPIKFPFVLLIWELSVRDQELPRRMCPVFKNHNLKPKVLGFFASHLIRLMGLSFLCFSFGHLMRGGCFFFCFSLSQQIIATNLLIGPKPLVAFRLRGENPGKVSTI